MSGKKTRLFFIVAAVLLLTAIFAAPAAAQEEPVAAPIAVGEPHPGRGLIGSLLNSLLGPLQQLASPQVVSVSRDDNGRTIELKSGDIMRLNLDQGYRWDVQVADKSVLTPIKLWNVKTMPRFFRAGRTGQTTLTAVGEPNCYRSQPACLAPTVLFQIGVAVNVQPTPGDRETVPAPIESVDIVVQESYPPRYRAQIVAGLPNGCAQPDGYQMSRSGNEIKIQVNNTMPKGDVMCTQQYRSYNVDVDLGTNFHSGETYTVDVNGTIETFVAQ